MFVCKKRALLTLSAIVLNGAFFFPLTCSILVFVGIALLFYTVFVFKDDIRFSDGLLWGVSFFALHFMGISFVVWEQGSGSFRMIFPCLLILYFGLYGGITFWLAKMSCSLYPQSMVWLSLCWLVAFFIYFMAIHHYSFFIFGLCRGYVFALPLLPLVSDHHWLSLVAVCGISLCLVIVLMMALALALVLYYPCGESLVFAFITCVPFFYSCWVPISRETAPAYIQNFAYCSRHENYFHPLDAAQHINTMLENAMAKKPMAQIMIMPESSYPFHLTRDAVQLWSQNALASGLKLIIGAHRKEDDDVQNCLFFIANGEIIQRYVKNQPMIFTEYVPFPWSIITSAHSLFLGNKKGFSSTKKNMRENLVIDECTKFSPCICSELFFDAYPQKNNDATPWLCLVNDSWFSLAYMPELMLLYAQLYAVERHYELLYISHYYGVGLGRNGEIWPL